MCKAVLCFIICFLMSTISWDMSWSEQGTNTPNPLALAAKDLLGIENATAEDIMLLAHGGDTRAMALVVAGYARGIGGFPKEPFLAEDWSEVSLRYTSIDPGFVMALMRQIDNGREHPMLGVALLQCEHVKESVVGQVFMKTGVLDLDAHCASLERKKSAHALWEDEYITADTEMKKALQATLSTIDFIRKNVSNLMDEKEEQLFEEAVRGIGIDELLFFAATTHNPASEAPDWSPIRLLSVLDNCRISLQRSSPTHFPFFAQISETVITAILNGLDAHDSDVQQEARELVRLAHLHKIQTTNKNVASTLGAMREMAQNYKTGKLGFIRSYQLFAAWNLTAALTHDARSMLSMALRSFRDGKIGATRTWVLLYGDHPLVDEELLEIPHYLLERADALQPVTTREDLDFLWVYEQIMEQRQAWRTAQEQ